MKRWIALAALAAGLIVTTTAHGDKEKEKPKQPAAAQEPSAGPAIPPEKLALIKKVMEADGTRERMKQLIEDMKLSMRSQMGDLPEDFWKILDEEINLEELIDLEAGLYHREYSPEDLEGLVKLYATPLGKKLASAQPAIERDSFMVAQDWGRALLNKTGARFQAKFAQPKAPGEPDAAPPAPAK